MILIFFLCLKLSIFHLCVSDLGYQCKTDDTRNNPEIFLIEDRNNAKHIIDISHQEQLNLIFERLCSDYYNIIKGSLEESEKYNFKNVIHFAVPDYYDGKPLENFVYAGNISKIDNAVVCTKTDKAPPEFDCNEIVNLVSKSVLEINDGNVYNFVQEMEVRARNIDQIDSSSRAVLNRYSAKYRYYPFKITARESCEPVFRNTSDLTIVLLCLRGTAYLKEKVNIQPLQLIQVTDCSHYLNGIRTSGESNWNRNSFLAVLAPEPFEVLSEYSVPTIFYETPYLFSENKTTFPNSMNLVPWRLLKFGFLKFIQTVGWQRVAIVTDDSEYSLDFEDELTALFNKEQIMYTVVRCEDAKCEMSKIAQELSRISARVVIANVEENHAQYLFRNAHHKITWLVRDMAGERYNQYLPNYQAFSISLSIERYTEGCSVEGNILTGLSSIAQAYKIIAKEDYKVKKLEFYRRFADKAKQITPRITEATVVVHKLYRSEVISRMSVNATGAKVISFTNPYVSESDKPNDGTAHCLVTSYDYLKPCEDPLVVFLMFIIMIFMLTFLLIVCYFDKTSPFNDIRYQNF